MRESSTAAVDVALIKALNRGLSVNQLLRLSGLCLSVKCGGAGEELQKSMTQELCILYNSSIWCLLNIALKRRAIRCGS